MAPSLVCYPEQLTYDLCRDNQSAPAVPRQTVREHRIQLAEHLVLHRRGAPVAGRDRRQTESVVFLGHVGLELDGAAERLLRLGVAAQEELREAEDQVGAGREGLGINQSHSGLFCYLIAA